jgi:hypothetical protein
MHYALNSSTADRNNLWDSLNLIATGCLNTQPVCLPHADFDANRNMVCEGGSIQLFDESWSSSATSWQWTLTNTATGTVLTSTQQNPTFTNMTNLGWYDVQLVATNATGTDTKLKQNYLLVSADQAVMTPLYSESFEDPNYHYFGYISNDRYNNGTMFQRTAGIGYTGSSSIFLNSYGNSLEGDIDELITPSYDLRYNSGMQLTFRYSYATAATAGDLNTQILKVWSSTDCGQTWSPRWTGTGSSMVTAGYSSSFFVPQNSAQWELVTINLPANFNAQSNVRFKFEFTSPKDGVGNNLYIDDINILTTNVGIAENTDGAAFNVYPNPGDGNSSIVYTLNQQANVKCDIFDVSGRLVSSVNKGEQGAGNYTIPVNGENSTLAPGTYMIQMTIGDQVTTRKYVVTEKQ